MHRTEQRQHASQLPNGLGRSFCGGIVHLCWILAENEGPSCSQRAESAKKSDSTGKTPNVLQVLFWRDVIYKLTGRSCLNSFTPMGSGGNEKLPPRRFPTVGMVWIIRRTTTQLSPTNIITMVLRLPPIRRRFNESPQSNAWAAIQRGRSRALRRGFL